MSAFSNLLEEYMRQNDIHISKLSQLSEIDRTVVYRYVKGTRVPSSIGTVNLFSDVLCLTNKERDLLIEAWECEVWGKELVSSYNHIQQMLINLQECNCRRKRNHRIYMNEKICEISGNLDVELEYSSDMVTWKDAQDAADVFSANKWEPGYTEVVYFKVTNAGSLAFKYQVGTNIVKEIPGKNQLGAVFNLSDYLQFGIVEVDSKLDDRAAAIAAVKNPSKFSAVQNGEATLKATESKTFAMVVWMPESTGNVANHDGTNVPEIQFGVNVIAAQATVEEDSYDEKYDEKANYPSAIYIPADTTLDGTVTSPTLGGNTVIAAADNTLTLGNNKNIAEDTAVDMSDTTQKISDSIKAENGQNLTMINGELVKDGSFGKVRFDTKGKDQVGLFENMTFTDTEAPSHTGSSSNDTEEMIQICPNGGGAGKYIFRNCTFNNAYVGIRGMNDGASVELVFEGCTFNNTGNAASIDFDDYYCPDSKVTIKDCTFNLAATSSINAVYVKGSKTGELIFEGNNIVNGSIADANVYKLFSTQSVKAYSASSKTTVTGADTITVNGIATK